MAHTGKCRCLLQEKERMGLGIRRRLQAAAMKPRTLARLQEVAEPYMEEREIICRAMFGQTGGPTGGFALWGSVFGDVKFVIVVATDRNVYVFRRGLFQAPRLKGLFAKYPIDASTEVWFQHGALTVNDDVYWVAALIAQSEARDLAAFVKTTRDRPRDRSSAES